jgi:hypothetical protein
MENPLNKSITLRITSFRTKTTYQDYYGSRKHGISKLSLDISFNNLLM